MKRFAALLDRLVYTPQRNDKLRLLEAYFRSTPDPDRGWALAVLTDGLPFSFPVRRTLAALMAERLDPVLFQLSRDYVGDTAETVALAWPAPATAPGDGADALRLADVVTTLQMLPASDLAPTLARWLDALDTTGRWALLKVLTGALRVGVSSRLAKTAVAAVGARDADAVETVWHGIAPPYAPLFEWLEGRAPPPDVDRLPVFRPLMLAHPLEDADREKLAPETFAAEWKWDGIRVQVAAIDGEARLYSRTGDDISRSFPEIVEAFQDVRAVLDGELLIVRDGQVAPFNDLQQRLNRKTVSRRMLAGSPAHVRLYDALRLGGDDLRALPFSQRRQRLEAWHADAAPPLSDLSAMLDYEDLADLERIWSGTRAQTIEGLMLKRWDSPYLAGRPKGHWFKWKRAPLTLDCVLMYAQRGSGRRSSYYSDYTFGAWQDTGEGQRTLLPVGKAYSGFTDTELVELDRWIRNHTTDRFGPVRAVAPELVLEVAFDAVQPSERHKSRVAMRFPRIHRIRWDKPAHEADTLETLKSLIEPSADGMEYREV